MNDDDRTSEPPATRALRQWSDAWSLLQVVAVLVVGVTVLLTSWLEGDEGGSVAPQPPVREPLDQPAGPCPGRLLDHDYLLDPRVTGPSYPLLDRGLQALRDGRHRDAALALGELVEDHPGSPLAHAAYVMLAEMAKERGDLEHATGYYVEVRRYPPPENDLYFYATVELAKLDAAAGRLDDARRLRDEAIRAGDEFPDLPCAPVIAQFAEDLVFVGD